MKLVENPGGAAAKLHVINGQSATLGAAAENAVCLQAAGAGDYAACMNYHDGAWFLEALEEDVLICEGELVKSLKLGVGSRFNLCGRDFLVLDVMLTEDCAKESMALAVQNPSNGSASMPAVFRRWTMANHEFVSDTGEQAKTRTAGRLALAGLVCACLGPLLLGIGEILGLLLSLVSLSRRRLSPHASIMAWCGVIISLGWLVAIGIAGYALVNKDIVSHCENLARLRTEKLAAAEYAVKYALLADDDGDLEGEYVPAERMAEILELDPEIKNIASSLVGDGYGIHSENVSKDTFVIVAKPAIFGVSGFLSFHVDERGFLAQERIKEEGFSGPVLTEAAIGGEESSIMRRYQKDISKVLASAARIRFERGEYPACEKILENLKRHFPESEGSKSLASLENLVGKEIYETKAADLLEAARNYSRREMNGSALATYRLLVQGFPKFSHAKEAAEELNGLSLKEALKKLAAAELLLSSGHWNAVEKSLAELEADYKEALFQSDFKTRAENCLKMCRDGRERAALALLKQARQLEIEGQTISAYNTYKQIGELYPGTAPASKIGEDMKRTRIQIGEDTAKNYVAAIMHNMSLSNETAVLNAINLLKESCQDTEEYKRSKTALEKIRRDCTVKVLLAGIDEHFKKGNYRAALELVEQAIFEKPDLFDTLKPIRESALLDSFNGSYDNGHYDEALGYYDRFVSLLPDSNSIPPEKAAVCRYERAKNLYKQGRFKEALELLEMAAGHYVDKPNFLFLAGKLHALCGHWQEALVYLDGCGNLDESYQFEMHAVRAFVRWQVARKMDERFLMAVCTQNELLRSIVDYKFFLVDILEEKEMRKLEGYDEVNSHVMVSRRNDSQDILVTISKKYFDFLDAPAFANINSEDPFGTSKKKQDQNDATSKDPEKEVQKWKRERSKSSGRSGMSSSKSFGLGAQAISGDASDKTIDSSKGNNLGNVIENSFFFHNRLLVAVVQNRNLAATFRNWFPSAEKTMGRYPAERRSFKEYNIELGIQKDFAILDECETFANKEISSCLARDYECHKNLAADFTYMLERRPLTHLRPQFSQLVLKYESLLKLQETFREYSDKTKMIRKEAIEIFEPIPGLVRKLAVYEALFDDTADALTAVYGEDYDYPQRFLEAMAEDLKIEIDLSSLEEYLPKGNRLSTAKPESPDVEAQELDAAIISLLEKEGCDDIQKVACLSALKELDPTFKFAFPDEAHQLTREAQQYCGGAFFTSDWICAAGEKPLKQGKKSLDLEKLRFAQNARAVSRQGSLPIEDSPLKEAVNSKLQALGLNEDQIGAIDEALAESRAKVLDFEAETMANKAIKVKFSLKVSKNGCVYAMLYGRIGSEMPPFAINAMRKNDERAGSIPEVRSDSRFEGVIGTVSERQSDLNDFRSLELQLQLFDNPRDYLIRYYTEYGHTPVEFLPPGEDSKLRPEIYEKLGFPGMERDLDFIVKESKYYQLMHRMTLEKQAKEHPAKN